MKDRFDSAFSYVLIYVFAIFDEQHKGCLKVGMASLKLDDESQYPQILTPGCTLLNKAARERIDSYTKTAGIKYTLLYTELAERKTQRKEQKQILVKYFDDHKVHDVLKNSGIQNVKFGGSKEWFRTDLDTVKNAIKAVKEGRKTLTGAEITTDHVPIDFRPEQEEAISMTVKRFKSGNKMLWNAKMRFGKTLSTLEVIKREKYKKTIILTHRPVVDKGWSEDFSKIFWNSNYTYLAKGTQESLIQNYITRNDPFVLFASIQDLRGSQKVGGKFDKNDIIFRTNWDLVVVDEAHEGTKTSLGDDVIKEIIKEDSYGKTKQIYLSGTPFNLVNDFEDDEIYTWDYVMEQKAKSDWDIIHGLDSNPYEGLPKLSIFTYDIANAIPGYEDVEDKAFNFREFFRTWTGIVQYDGKLIPQDSGVGRFVHEKDVVSFLQLLRLTDEDTNYPYSRDEYRNYFRHTLWMLPGVREASAMEKLLNEDKVFSNFQIVNVAGDSPSGENANALEKLNKAISEHSESTWTITLSCGRLTTGVTVKPWTAVLMLSGTNSTSASLYLQTIFRVQSPANINGRIKDRCFVFDFAPDRTLQMVAEAGKLSPTPGSNSDEAKMREFLNFCPVIAIKGSEMKTYDVDTMLRQLKRYYAARVAQNGFDDVKLYNDSLLTLTEYDKKKFDDLKKIIGESKAADIKRTIVISESGLGPEEQEAAEEAQRKKKQKTELTEEDKEALKKLKEAREAKSKAISILRAISIRIPLLIYGMQKNLNENITIDSFAKLVDDISWNEFMPTGITKAKFNEIKEYYDKDIFIEAGNQIRWKVKAADDLTPTERVKKITQVFATFKNPDKETVLTPWRVVNMHLSACLGGYDFFDEDYSEMLEEPRFVNQGKVTDQTIANTKSKILEINSKSGLYPLYVTYSIYRKRLSEIPEDLRTEELQEQLWRQTIEENVFVICKTEMAKFITKRTLLGYKEGKINAHYFEDLINQFKNKSDQVIKKIKSQSYWNQIGGGEMRFDAVVGNPPYQEETESDSTRKPPIYNVFFDCSFDLSDKVSLITPARFLFEAGYTPKQWNQKMLEDKHFKVVKYYPDSRSVFPSVDIKGGIIISYRDIKKDFGAIGIFTKDPEMKNILEKVRSITGKYLDSIIASPLSYQLSTIMLQENPNSIGRLRTSAFTNLSDFFYDKKPSDGLEYISLIGLLDTKRVKRFIRKDYVEDNSHTLDLYKLLLPKAIGSGKFGEQLSTPIIAEPGTGHTQTFISIGGFTNRSDAVNVEKYVKTKFVRAMLGILKITQDCPGPKWKWVPLQDFSSKSDIDWSQKIESIDKQLYKKYGLTQDEISFIEENVLSME